MKITVLYAAPLALLYISLSLNVIRLRWKHQISLGTGGIPKIERAIRAHGNFSEYVPLALILITMAEFRGAPSWSIHLFGLTLLIGRLLHGYCLCIKYVALFRQMGVFLTLLTLLSVAITAFFHTL